MAQLLRRRPDPRRATLHASVADAVADLHHVFATCPRPRHIIKPVLTARGAAAELREICARDLRAGVLFGPERAGLDNDDMAQADALVRYPLNPGVHVAEPGAGGDGPGLRMVDRRRSHAAARR